MLKLKEGGIQGVTIKICIGKAKFSEFPPRANLYDNIIQVCRHYDLDNTIF